MLSENKMKDSIFGQMMGLNYFPISGSIRFSFFSTMFGTYFFLDLALCYTIYNQTFHFETGHHAELGDQVRRWMDRVNN